MEKATRVAALYDVHGNLPALEAVLSDIEGVDVNLLVIGGDEASGPMPAEALDRLEAIGDRVRWVRGNADREIVSARRATPRSSCRSCRHPASSLARGSRSGPVTSRSGGAGS
jgi:predicted phosphodiesterase